MQYAALSPLPIARGSPSVSYQQGFVTEGYHFSEVEFLCQLSPTGLGDFNESDLTRLTRLKLVANLPWLRLIDLMCTLLNDQREKAADNGLCSTGSWGRRCHSSSSRCNPRTYQHRAIADRARGSCKCYSSPQGRTHSY